VNPARVVIDETRRSFAYLSLYGVATDAVLVNRVLPPEAAAGYFAHRGGSAARTCSRNLWRSGSRSALHPRPADSTHQTRRSDRDELDVAVHGDQLLVRVRDVRRRIALPDSVAGRPVAAAKLNEGVLEVVFEA